MAKEDNKPPSFKDLINAVQPKENINNELDSLKGLELAKIIVKEFLNDDNLFSLSFLNYDQIDDLANAKVLNIWFGVDDIDDYINNLLKLLRSDKGLAFRLLIKMVMFNQNNDDLDIQKHGFFPSILKR